MSRLTRVSTKKSSFIPTQAKFSPPPVLQPKAEKQPDAKLPEWKPGGGGATNPVQRLLNRKAVQAKLTIGQPGDAYVQVADRVAAKVMSMPAPADSSASVQRQLSTNNPNQIWQEAQSITPVVQTQIDSTVQMRQIIQRVQRADKIEGNQASGDLESRLNASKGGGSPLSEPVRRFMEPRFGADFSSVRVHTGSSAVQMNRELGAQAFTHGSDVYFGEGKSPGNNELTAHELTHVVQQNTTVVQQKSQPLENPKVSLKEISILNEVRPKSEVLIHLQSLRENTGYDSSVYRKEILQFQWENPQQKIAASQQQVLEQAQSVNIQQKDNSQTLRRCGCSRSQQRQPGSLANTIRTMLQGSQPVNHSQLIQAIHAAPVAERQAVLQDATLRNLLNSRLSDDEATTFMSSLLEGSQRWQNPTNNDFYRYFVLQRGNPPTSTSSMNCWESIMYAAYLANQIDANWIRSFYQNALSSGVDPNITIWATLGWSTSLPQYPRTTPRNGQLLFYYDSGDPYPGHVAISLGGDQAISLWNQPNNVDSVQRIKVTDLSGTVYISNPPW